MPARRFERKGALRSGQRREKCQALHLNHNRQDWYTMANFRIEYDSLGIQHTTAIIGFDPRFIRVNPRLNSLFVPIFLGVI
jgi:hypothetical protein